MTRGRPITYEQRVRARILIARADQRIASDLAKMTTQIKSSPRAKTTDQLVYERRDWLIEVRE